MNRRYVACRRRIGEQEADTTKRSAEGGAASPGSSCVGSSSDIGTCTNDDRVEPWGCDFVADPKLGWRTAHAFWLPRIAADVVSFVPSPLTLSSNIFVDDLQRGGRPAASLAKRLLLPVGIDTVCCSRTT